MICGELLWPLCIKAMSKTRKTIAVSKTIRIFVVLKSCAGGEMVDALVSGASVNCDV